jgi:hypothetical protein
VPNGHLLALASGGSIFRAPRTDSTPRCRDLKVHRAPDRSPALLLGGCSVVEGKLLRVEQRPE